MEVLGLRGGGVVLSMLLLLLTCAVLLKMQGVSGNLHKIQWEPGINYTEWSTKEQFYVDDWLYFNYNKYMYNVLEVNMTDYETCSSDHPISNFTGGAGRDVFHLIEAKPYYFLSSGGYCWQNMKLAIVVQNIPPTQAPQPPKNGSPSNSGSWNFLPTVLAIAMVWTSL